jgi:DNA-directed RNA polymerase specialized sigma24 family protein
MTPLGHRGEAPPTPMTIWEEIAQGRTSSVNTFCRLYGPFIFTLARGRGLSHADADDVMTVVLMNMLKQIQKKGLKVDHSRGLFRSYLATAVGREVRRLMRGNANRGGRGLPPGLGDSIAPPDAGLEEIERRERYMLILDTLRTRGPGGRKPANWTRRFAAFYDYAVMGTKPKTVAERYGIPVEELYRIRYKMLEAIRVLWDRLDRELGEV